PVCALAVVATKSRVACKIRIVLFAIAVRDAQQLPELGRSLSSELHPLLKLRVRILPLLPDARVRRVRLLTIASLIVQPCKMLEDPHQLERVTVPRRCRFPSPTRSGPPAVSRATSPPRRRCSAAPISDIASPARPAP